MRSAPIGGLWGLSEAVFGGPWYNADVPHGSVPLTIMGLVILTFARVYYPRPGTATLIASFAMLFKFLNVPHFTCHLLVIVLTGLCYDLSFNVLKIRAAWLAAASAIYVNYAAFALIITYVARNIYWVYGGFDRIVRYVAIDGSIVAVTCAVLVPLSLRYGERLRSAIPAPFAWRATMLPRGVAYLTAGLWAVDMILLFVHHDSCC